MTGVDEVDPILKRARSAAFWLTVGLWLFSIFSFAGSISIGAGGLSTRIQVWLAAITLTGVLITVGLYALVNALSARPAETRWVILGVAVLAATLGQSSIDGILNEAISRLFGRPSGEWINRANFAVNCLIYIWLYGFYVAALELISSTARAAQHARREAAFALQVAEAREQAREAQLQMLRFQLNPHFLFNTLNSISSLVVAGRTALAEEMISRLCQFMRASLKPGEDALVSLGAELATMEAYIEIESIRFSDTLDIEIDCPPALEDALVPGLILQPLIENAIKYALTPSEGASRMRISIRGEGDRLEISVADEGPGHDDCGDAGIGSGIGLENIRRRLAVLYGDKAWLDAGASGIGFHARICLPLQSDLLPKAA